MEKTRPKYTPKPEFVERMKELLQGEKDFEEYMKVSQEYAPNSIRCNTIKISPDELKKRLEKKWKIVQPYKEYPEIMLIESELAPGEIGKAIEHVLGYYYVQEISSMLPPFVLNPKADEIVLDLCSSPGSKTTQMAAMMENKGTLIANDVSIGRIMILSTNIQRCCATNVIVTENEGSNLCSKLAKNKFLFDKILVDAPCSCEGTIRSSPKTVCTFSESLIKRLSNTQKSLAVSAVKCLKVGGELVYSTCTHAPEENEEVVSYLLDNFPLEIEEINLPLKTREGIVEWKGKKYNSQVKKCIRIYPHDNDTEGFFVARIKKIGEIQ
ncbi:MAG: RsmB/NOP family class I SAM-dependent RNA methyltransferase [Candidatus Pacearchaeota archaeon]|jgi:NOL1/NOP2/sun family putative RNA methylase